LADCIFTVDVAGCIELLGYPAQGNPFTLEFSLMVVKSLVEDHELKTRMLTEGVRGCLLCRYRIAGPGVRMCPSWQLNSMWLPEGRVLSVPIYAALF